jgi:hypothetical protein
MSKYYFREDNDEQCFQKISIIEQMKDENLTELLVFEAKRVTGEGYFYCHELDVVGEVGEGCGKMCEKYSPCNGKNGRCKHSGYTYDQTEKSVIFRNK